MSNTEKVVTPETPETPKTEIPVDEIPHETSSKEKNSWVEEIEMASDQLVARIKELVAEGNVRRLIIRKPDGEVMLEVPLTTGVAVGGVFTIFVPVLAAIGALAALVAHVKVEVVREGTEK